MDKLNLSLEQLLDLLKLVEKQKDDFLVKKIIKLYSNIEEDNVSLKLDDPLSIFLINHKEITIDELSTAYIRAIYKNNSEVKKKLKKYLYEYLNNLESGIDNTYIIEIIKDDKKLYDYIKEYENIKKYSTSLIKNKKQQKKVPKLEEKKVKGKAFIA